MQAGVRRGQPACKQSGLTIVEMMMASVLGLFIVMAAISLLVSGKSSYVFQQNGAQLQEAGRFAIESIERAVHQTAYEHWGGEQAPFLAAADFSPNIAGLDARSLKASTAGIDFPIAAAVNGSDVLALRFFGAGPGTKGDGSMLNCAGFSVGTPSSSATAEDERGWSIFYVAKGAGGEPELRCKYRSKQAWTADALVPGVESFQVLYGLDMDGDGLPERYITASSVSRLDDALSLDGQNAAARAIDWKRKTFWKRVVAVKVALLLRGSERIGIDDGAAQFDLFGKEYGDASSADDPGTRIRVSDLPLNIRGRLRKVFVRTVQLRNRAAGSQT